MKKSTHAESSIQILSVRFEKLRADQILARLEKALYQNEKLNRIYTPNPQILLSAERDPALGALLSRADLLLPDGIGLCIGSRLLGTPLPCRVAGIDAAWQVLALAEQKGLSVALLGAKPGVAESASKNLRQAFPRLNVCYTHHGYFDREGTENNTVLAELRAAAPDILFVCFGFPAQEIWLDRHAHTLPSLRLCMGLGGSLDVWAGELRRAPRVISACGLEWLWRTLCEPRRARIFLDIPHFLFLIAKQRYREQKSRSRP